MAGLILPSTRSRTCPLSLPSHFSWRLLLRVSTRATFSFRFGTTASPSCPSGARVGTSSQRRRAQLKAGAARH